MNINKEASDFILWSEGSTEVTSLVARLLDRIEHLERKLKYLDRVIKEANLDEDI